MTDPSDIAALLADPNPAALRQALKQLIVQASGRDVEPASIGDDDSLIGSDSTVGLDSLDVLQINVALHNHFGVRIDDGKHARRVMKSVAALADFVRAAAQK